MKKSKELMNWRSRLQKLKEKKALYGMDAPPQLDIEIGDIEAKIKELELEENIEEGIASVMPGSDLNSSQVIDPILKGFVSTIDLPERTDLHHPGRTGKARAVDQTGAMVVPHGVHMIHRKIVNQVAGEGQC